MLDIEVRGIRELERALRRVRVQAVYHAHRRAMDEGARLGVKLFVREWRKEFKAGRRKSFPGSALRVLKSYVDQRTGVVRRPARIVNKPGSDATFNTQFGGNRVKTPRKGRHMFVPGKKGRRVRKGTYVVESRWVFHKSRGYVGALRPSITMPDRVDINVIVRKLGRLAENLLRRELRKEIREQVRRGRL